LKNSNHYHCRITLTGEFTIQPTKECQSKTKRTIQPEVQGPPVCVFNGTLPIQITRNMMPYSTLLVYTFQPSFGFNVAESYRFSVAGLFQSPLVLNATIVPYTSTNNVPQDYYDNSDENSSSEGVDLQSVTISNRAQDKTRVQLSFTGTPGSTVGLNVIEYDGVIQGLSNEITKERVLQYLTTYEQVPIVGMPTNKVLLNQNSGFNTRNVESEEDDHTSTVYSDYETSTLHDKKRDSDNKKREAEDSTSEETDKKKRGSKLPPTTKKPYVTSKQVKVLNTRTVVSEDEEEHNIIRERLVS
jgi:hypothetical protein